MPETERLRTTGTLDPSRLPLADVVSAIFRRYQGPRAGRQARPPVMDGGLRRLRFAQQPLQIRMLKILVSPGCWPRRRGKAIQVLAAVYHTDTIRQGLYGPLVQWLYHPRKTPATSRKDATRALVSLPDSGIGGQIDALSLAFIMDEAVALARGRRIYPVLLTDCSWYNSFNIGKCGKDEVHSYFHTAYARWATSCTPPSWPWRCRGRPASRTCSTR